MNAQDGSAEQWLASFTKQLRGKLPQSQYLLTHARECSWYAMNSKLAWLTWAYSSGRSMVLRRPVQDRGLRRSQQGSRRPY